MLSIDSNVLLRNIVQDIGEQAEAARILIESLSQEQPGFVCREVVLEVAWVLERTYKFPRNRIADVLLGMAGTDGVIVEDVEDVSEAVRTFRDSNADFSDLLILAASRRAGATPLYTFDRKLARMEGATLLA